MKKQLFILLLSQLILWSCKTPTNEVNATLDLVNVANDKVKVMVKPATIASTTITFQVPKIIPGTYALQDYGRYIEDFKAFDKSGNLLSVSNKDVNTWLISDEKKLDRVEYLFNDTFDEEVSRMEKNETVPFSPAGTNILKDQNFY
ncbi:MAG: hypothetical protein U5K51_14505 [Flavobacteriaceae bacterium]|nr:hypothetical protein [Flavobacteriaceae bacterium]